MPTMREHPDSVRLPTFSSARKLYDSLLFYGDTPQQYACLHDFLETHLAAVNAGDGIRALALPRTLPELLHWTAQKQAAVHEQYQHYLSERKAGAPRRFFHTRSHALYFLRAVAPTKLVDGSWLYSSVLGGFGSSAAHLIRTYFEELGDGDVSKNHVGLYRQLLAANGAEQWRTLGDELFVQGAVQLALGFSGTKLIPEVIGFNLGYEQLPLHLLITAHELDELGIDPYYFSLHITVDNLDTGHARRACEAACERALDFSGDNDTYWSRVAAGYLLNNVGSGTVSVIENFDLQEEMLDFLTRKAAVGQGAHSDYCRIEGHTVNEWLARPGRIGEFVGALERHGWIRRGQEPEESPFWRLLIGDRAKMFGVFSDYELQVVFDWIRGSAAVDGRPYSCPSGVPLYAHRVTERRQSPALLAATDPAAEAQAESALLKELRQLPENSRWEMLTKAISPQHHWTARGRAATRLWLKTRVTQT